MLKAKDESGITLISLVITIIVMLILASVAINLTIGDNGIFTKAKEAKIKMEIAMIKEQIQMDILTEQLADNGKISEDKLIEILDKYGEVQIDEEGKIVGVKTDKGGYYISIDDLLNNEQINPPTPEVPDEGKITNIILSQNTLELEEGNTETLIITIQPENIIDKEVEWTSDATDVATVDTNGKITAVKEGTATITVSAKNNNAIKAECIVTVIEKLKTDSEGNKQGESGYLGGTYNDPYIPRGFQYTREGKWNSGYTIIGKTSSVGNEFVWVPCILTEEQKQEAATNGHTVQIFKKTTTGKYNEYGYGLLPTDKTIEAEDSSVQAIEESVRTYGGFYIAKYEAGIPGAKESVATDHGTSTEGDILPVSKPNVGVWNYISRTEAITVSKAMIDNSETGVYSTLISGAAWDTTLQWMVNSSDNKKENTGYDINSTDRGLYSGTIAVTGSETVYSVNNIYDMAGNVSEYTTENCTLSNGSNKVHRGGCVRLCCFFISGIKP